MEKLQLKHLAPYLPYKLNVNTIDGNGCIERLDNEFALVTCDKSKLSEEFYLEDIKPILRPLSDLPKDENIETWDGLFNLDKDNQFYIECLCEAKGYTSNQLRYDMVILLIKNHFDIFGLINKGLAIDKNTL